MNIDNLIHAAAAARIAANEDADPITAISTAIKARESVSEAEKKIIYYAHVHGPWTVDTEAKFKVFHKWCNICGNDFAISDIVLKLRHDYRIYVNDFGDCVFAEAAKGRKFAIWTRKDRLYIGFRDDDLATKFRDADNRFSVNTTGNKNLKLVVVENGDNSKTIAAALDALDSARNE